MRSQVLEAIQLENGVRRNAMWGLERAPQHRRWLNWSNYDPGVRRAWL